MFLSTFEITVDTRTTEELTSSTFMKSDWPMGVYWADKVQILKTNNKYNVGSTTDNTSKLEDWEHKLKGNAHLEK